MTDITEAGYPRVNNIAVAWVVKDDGTVFDPREIRNKCTKQN